MQNQLDEGIYVEAKKAPGFSVFGKYHSYLVYRDGKGGEWVIRGGVGADMGVLGGNIETEADIPLQNSKDAYGDGETPAGRHSRKLDLGGRAPKEVWKKMSEQAKEIHQRGIEYNSDNPTGSRGSDGFQNSNSTIRSVLKAGGVEASQSLPEGLNESVLPGWENDLSKPSDRWLGDASQPNTAQEGDKTSPATPAPAPEASLRAEVDPFSAPEGSKVKAALADTTGLLPDFAFKPVKDWTADEAKRAQHLTWDLPSRDPRRAEVQDKITAYHGHVWGADPVAYDAIGRMIRPAQPKNPPPGEARPLTSLDGRAVADGVLDVGKQVAQAANRNGAARAIQALQVGLNLFNAAPALKVDGWLGPKTNDALRRTVQASGAEKAKEAFGLGQVKRLGDLAKRETVTPRTVDEGLDHAFGDLYSQADDPAKPRPYKQVFQDTLNDAGHEALGPDWQPLKDDGVVGPKTTQAFQTLVRRDEQDGFATRLGRNLGFFG